MTKGDGQAGSSDVYGKLYYDPSEPVAIKCLVAAQFGRRRIELAETPKTDGLLERSRDRVQFFSYETNAMYNDSFVIAWLLIGNKNPKRPLSTKFASKLMQWHYFALGDVVPHVRRLLSAFDDAHTKNKGKNFGDALLKAKKRLWAAFDTIALTFEANGGRFLLGGQEMTLADVFVAVEIWPLLTPAVQEKKFFEGLFQGASSDRVLSWLGDVSKDRYFEACAGMLQFKFTTAHRSGPKVQKKGKKALQGDVNANIGSNAKGVKKEDKIYPPLDLPSKPFKVLCLHGYRQNGNTFRAKIGSFRNVLSKYVEFVFVTAPHHVLAMSAEDINLDQRGWWFSRENFYFKADDSSDCDKGFSESLGLVWRTIEEQGPFDGILGFSQGAALAAILCLEMAEKCPKTCPIKFAIMFAAFKSQSSHHSKFYRGDRPLVTIPTLHVIGKNDHIINKAMSEELLPLFEKPDVVYHDGGHLVRAAGEQKRSYMEFLSKVHGRYPVPA